MAIGAKDELELEVPGGVKQGFHHPLEAVKIRVCYFYHQEVQEMIVVVKIEICGTSISSFRSGRRTLDRLIVRDGMPRPGYFLFLPGFWIILCSSCSERVSRQACISPLRKNA